MRRPKDILLVGLGMVLAVLTAEVGLRIVEDTLPDRAVWPSVEAHIKGEQLLSTPATADVLFIGSSMTEAAVDPLVLHRIKPSLTAYNAALPFSKPVSIEYWLEAVALPSVRPTAVVYGLAPWPVRDNPGRDSFLDGLRGAVQRRTLFAGVSNLSVLLGNVGLLADWEERTRITRQRDAGC
jgi:hypothetical protein